jgi:hypothetical protein
MLSRFEISQERKLCIGKVVDFRLEYAWGQLTVLYFQSQKLKK